MKGDPICANCAQETPTLAPCPCGLAGECPMTGGVCGDCYQTAVTNAVARRKERAA